MKRLTQAEKRTIAKDWKNVLPEYEVYKQSMLLKRYGPVLVGLYLHPVCAGTNYAPEFHTHSLIRGKETISLETLVKFRTKNGAQDTFSFRRHQANFDTIVAGMKSQIPELFFQELTFTALDSLYKRTIDSITCSGKILMSPILAMKWCGKDSLIDARIAKYKSLIMGCCHNPDERPEVGENWEKEVRTLMNSGRLEEMVEESVVKLKLTKLKDHGLICD